MIWWLLGIAALFAAVAIMPVDLICELGGRSLRVKVRCLGLTFGARTKRPKPLQERPVELHEADHETHGDLAVLWSHRKTLEKVVRTALDLTRRLARAWSLKSGQLSVRIGTGNPATTGMIYGGLAAALGVFSHRWPQVQVDCQARFEERIMDLGGHLVFRSRPGTLVGHLIRAAFRLPWRGLWQLRRDYAAS